MNLIRRIKLRSSGPGNFRSIKPRRFRPGFERLEDRQLLAVAWVPQGPGPALSSGTMGMVAQGSPVAGAVEALAPHPTNPDILFAATVGGGIWKTVDAYDPSPTWTPLTDFEKSTSIGDLRFSPLDANVLYAATGNYSNGANVGVGAGLLKSTDGGTSWQPLNPNGIFTGLNIRNVVPTRLLDPQTHRQIVLAGTYNPSDITKPAVTTGVYRSPDGGATWALLSGNGTSGLPTGQVSDIVADPADPSGFYAAVSGKGIFRTTGAAGGQASVWQRVDNPATSPITGAVISASGNIRMATHYSFTTDAQGRRVQNRILYALIVNNQGSAPTVWYTTDSGGNWTQMDIPGDGTGPGRATILPAGDEEGGQGLIDISIVADPRDPNKITVAGSTNPDDAANGGASDVGRIFVGDRSKAAGSQWTSLGVNGAGVIPTNRTIPAADSRTMIVDARNNVLESDDGGVYRLVQFDATGLPVPTPQWVAVMGNLTPGEVYSVAYDSVNHTLLAGLQDNSSLLQSEAGSLTWNEVLGGDGNTQAADNLSLPGESVHYALSNNFRAGMKRSVFDGSNTQTSQSDVLLAADGSDTRLDGLLAADSGETGFVSIPYVLDAIALAVRPGPQRLMIGFNGLYESFDNGDHLGPVGATNIKPDALNGRIGAIAYGGMIRGTADANLAYVGDVTFTPDGGQTMHGGNLVLRVNAGGAAAFVNLGEPLTGSPNINALALDPADAQRAYVLVDNGSGVIRIVQAITPITGSAPDYVVGATRFTDITAKLIGSGPNQLTSLKTVTVLNPTGVAGQEIVVVGGLGGVFATNRPNGNNTNWIRMGNQLPNMGVMNLKYDATDDVLIAGTFGRGVWTLPSFAQKLAQLNTAGSDSILAQSQAVVLFTPNQPDPITAYVNGLFNAILSRNGDPAGLAAFKNQIQAGVSRFTVFQEIWQSPDHRGQEIDYYYLHYLGRTDGAGEKAGWQQVFASGKSEAFVVASFVNSPEYGQAAASDGDFVRALFADVLNRNATSSDMAYWLSALQKGQTRASEVESFINSTEAYQQAIDLAYESFLARSPDSAGAQAWTSFLMANGANALETMVGDFLVSSEFAARTVG